MLGVLPPARQQATVWNVAVNGVMAGCAPEYMPLLLAVVECIADPQFGLQDAGSTPGWEPIVIVSGPLAEELDFNSAAGALRIGRRANSSLGRFLRLYMRNVAGLLPPPGSTDQGAIGATFFVALVEDDAFVRSELGWPTYREDHGYRPEDTIIGVQSARTVSAPIYSNGDNAEDEMWPIVRGFADTIGLWGGSALFGGHSFPLLILAPSVALKLKGFGWTKNNIREYLWDNLWTRVEDAERFLYLCGVGSHIHLRDRWEHDPSAIRSLFRSAPEPMGRMVLSSASIQIVVAGNPGRNQSKVVAQHGRQGHLVARRTVPVAD